MRRRVPASLLALVLLVGGPAGRATADEGSVPVEDLLRAARDARERGDLDAAIRWAERGVQAAATPEVRGGALRLLATLQISTQRPHAARRTILDLREVEVGRGDRNGVAAADVQLASVDASLGRWTSALARIDDAVAWLDAHGAAWERRGAHLNAAKIRLGVHDTARGREHLANARAAGTGLRLNDTSLWLLEGAAALQAERFDEAERA
jgi:hypothetical protein